MNADTKLPTAVTSPLMDPDSFGHMQRVANILANSPLFPDHLRNGSKEQAIANGVLVMNMAMRLNEDPLTVAQNIYFVGGKPGWSASYMISKANQHGVFSNPIDWEVRGEGDDLSVTAVATITATGKKVSATCDMKMAKAEGWTKNSKYQSMPVQMLRYRSATFLIRLYAPQVMVGIPATIEIDANNMRDVTPDEEAEIYAQRVPVDAQPEPAQAAPDAAEAAPGDSDVPAEHHKTRRDIIADLDDGAPVDATKSFYGEALAKMEREAPDFHAALMADMDDYAPEKAE